MSDYNSEEENISYIKKKVVFQALEVSLLLVGAFIFYDIVSVLKPLLLKMINNNKYVFNGLKIFLHVLFIFALDLVLRYIFAFSLETPL